MDSLKVGTYSDAADSLLEKGCPVAQPLHPETCHACSDARTRRRRCRRPFFKRRWIIVLGTAALTWLMFSYGQRAFTRPPQVWHWTSNDVGYPPLANGDIDQCVGSTDWTTHYDQPAWALGYPYGAETAFSLPLNLDALYLVSRGALQHGRVNIEQSPQAADTVDVRVRVAYNDDEALRRATVCQMERAEREHGVGIFTPQIVPHPRHHGHRDRLEFDVTVTLPAGHECPLSVKKLETEMPNYSQNVADLEESVSLTSDVGHFSSLNGEIDGHFNARSSLDLRTSNGRITPTVNLSHRQWAGPSNLTIHTLNGQIDAEISLTSGALIGGEFGVDAESKHGEIGLKFIDSPLDSVLRCHAETTVGAVEVELNSAFEGTYSLQTLFVTRLESQSNAEDPAGRGRHRVISKNDAHGRVEGEIKWVEENDGNSFENEGYVVLKSLVPSVKLIV
ncbi:hypothetical protein HD554DRAFT_2171971 [Boletus coccyginus]|nr:hypothetical protein HD554DRAFT_2171971 [Boletus coccyginus]